MPFIFVAGDHARNDVDVEWRAILEDEGYSVATIIEGLGQITQIQDIYIRHIYDAIESPIVDAAQQKAEFISNNFLPNPIINVWVWIFIVIFALEVLNY